MPTPAVAHADDHRIALAAHRQMDVRIGRAVFRGVVEQVADDLREADRIRVELDRVEVALEADVLPLLRDDRLGLLERALSMTAVRCVGARCSRSSPRDRRDTSSRSSTSLDM